MIGIELRIAREERPTIRIKLHGILTAMRIFRTLGKERSVNVPELWLEIRVKVRGRIFLFRTIIGIFIIISDTSAVVAARVEETSIGAVL